MSHKFEITINDNGVVESLFVNGGRLGAVQEFSLVATHQNCEIVISLPSDEITKDCSLYLQDIIKNSKKQLKTMPFVRMTNTN